MSEGGGVDRSPVLSFLYKIIDDSQSTIRFLDTKAGFGIAILGAIVGKVLLDQDELIVLRSHGWLISVMSLLFGIVVIVAAILGFRTVFPTVNPAENVSFPDDLKPQFFISKFRCCRFMRLFSSNKKFAVLELTHDEYCSSVRAADVQTLESILAAEVLKLAFIRQMKVDRLDAFSKALIVAVMLFVVLMFAVPRGRAQENATVDRDSPPLPAAIQNSEHVYNFNLAGPDRRTSHAGAPATAKEDLVRRPCACESKQ
jgi:hypothetical protein